MSGTFSNGAGTRSYKLYRPGASSPAAGQRVLVVVLHGCTQNADDIARGTRFNATALKEGWTVLYPEQPASANPLKCWNWYEPAQITRGAGEVSIIADLTLKIIKDEGIDPARVLIAGISAGGAMAANMVAEYPELWRAGAMHSSLPAHAANSQAVALLAMKDGAKDPDALGAVTHTSMGPRAKVVPMVLVHGVMDPLVSIKNLAASARQWLVTASRVTGEAVPGAVEVHPADSRLSAERYALKDGSVVVEAWRVEGVAHAWSGGSAEGTYTAPAGPDATALIAAFFKQQLSKR